MNKEEIKEYNRVYREQNRDRLRAYEKKRYTQRKEEMKKYRQKPEVKARIKVYRKTPEFKAYLQKYRQRTDVKAKRREYQAKNREKINARQKEYNERMGMDIYYKKYRQKIRQDFLSLYKKGKSCSLCGYNKYPEILQFHHTNKKDKFFNIANKVRTTSALNNVKSEIDKCILLCPNCHSWLHFKEHSSKRKV